MPTNQANEAAYRAGYSAGFRAGLAAFWQRLRAGWSAGRAFEALRGFWLGEVVFWTESDLTQPIPPPAPVWGVSPPRNVVESWGNGPSLRDVWPVPGPAAHRQTPAVLLPGVQETERAGHTQSAASVGLGGGLSRMGRENGRSTVTTDSTQGRGAMDSRGPRVAEISRELEQIRSRLVDAPTGERPGLLEQRAALLLELETKSTNG